MKIILTEAELTKGVGQLANEIGSTYGSNPLTILGVMTGSVVLLADLIRLLSIDRKSVV